MSDPLHEAEALCQQVLDALPSMKLLDEAAITSSLQTVLTSIRASRRKIMVRSAKGRELANAILAAAIDLHHAVTAGKNDGISERLKKVQAPVKKLEIYWRSFEYATT